MKTVQKSLLAGAVALAFAAPSMAAFTVDLGDQGSISFGGYLKLDARHESGDFKATSYYRGASLTPADTSSTAFSMRESRLTTTYKRGATTGYVEFDLYGGSGNELVSNSEHLRLRQAFITHGGWKIGQAWSAATNLIAIPETVDFGGPIVGMVFVRQPGIRYSSGGWTFSVENPETYQSGKFGTSGAAAGMTQANAKESTPDFITSYATSGDWGNIQVNGIVRSIDEGGAKHTATAFGAAAKLKFGQDDIRMQLNVGEWGRYIGAGQGAELGDFDGDGNVEMDSTTSYTIAYRHVMGDGWRSNVFFGGLEGDESGRDRTHFGANIMTTLAPGLTGGLEVGRYSIDDDGGAANGENKYLQLMVKMAL
jgi:hypothetical protein